MIDGVRRLAARLQSELSPTAQYGLIILASLLWGYFLLIFSEAYGQQKALAERQADTLAMLADGDAESVWIERQKEAERFLDQWQSRVWRATSPGVGAAEIEIKLRDLVQSNLGDALQIEVSPTPSQLRGVQYLNFVLSGRIPAGRVHELLVELGSSRQILAVTDLQLVEQQAESYSFRIDGFAPYVPISEGPE